MADHRSTGHEDLDAPVESQRSGPGGPTASSRIGAPTDGALTPPTDPDDTLAAQPGEGPARDPSDDPGRARGGLSSAVGEQFSLAAAIGGPRGVIESAGPPLVFIVAFTITRDLRLCLALAVGLSVIALLARVVTRLSPSQALSGVIGIAICAVFALRTGQARDFFLPGFFINAGYGIAFLVSLIPVPALTLAGHRLSAGPYPLLGLFLGPLTGEGLRWRGFGPRARTYWLLTAAWAGFFLLKVAVQVPLYLADQLQALGTAKILMGVPSYALMCWITWLVLRRIPKTPSDD